MAIERISQGLPLVNGECLIERKHRHVAARQGPDLNVRSGASSSVSRMTPEGLEESATVDGCRAPRWMSGLENFVNPDRSVTRP